MAKTASSTKTANPMLTRNGKTRLGPLSLVQLNDLLEKSSKPKDKSKIRNRMTQLRKILNISEGKFKVVTSTEIE